MSNTIRIKRRASGSPGAPASLNNAELAYNEVDEVLYYGKGTGGAGGSATVVQAVGGPGWAAPLASPALSGTPTAPTAAQNTSTTQLATTAFVLNQANGVAGTITANGVQAAGSSNLYARADHVHPTDTTRAPLASPALTGTPTAPTAAVNTSTTQLATTAFVLGQASSTAPAALGSAAAGAGTTFARSDHVHAMPTLSQLGTATADVSLGGYKLSNLADPVNAQDAATKNYVDSAAQGLDIKPSVKAASTANLTLSGPQTVDGVALAAGDRVLVKNQTAAAQNGIYLVAAGSWSRAADLDAWSELPGAFTFVEQGTANGDTGWVCTVDAGGTLGTTAIAFVQFSGAGTYVAGNGLTLTGSTFAAVGTANRITIGAGGIDIASTYVGQSTLTTLGTVTTGTWNASTLGVAYGGTGATSLTGLIKGNGGAAFTAATAGTDYLDPNSTIDGGTF